MNNKKCCIVAFGTFVLGVIIGITSLQWYDHYMQQAQEIILEELVIAVEPEKNVAIEITSQEELRFALQNSKKQSVFFFHMDGCGWCKKVKPVFEQVVENPVFNAIQFYSVDGRSSQAGVVIQELFNQKISGFPTFVFTDNGKYIDKQVGFLEQSAFEDKINSVFFGKKPTSNIEAQPSSCQHKNNNQKAEKLEIAYPNISSRDYPEGKAAIEEFIQAADQLPQEKFNGFRKIEDEALQKNIDHAYEAYKKLYNIQNKFYVTPLENDQIKEGAKKLFNLKLIRNMVWRGHVQQ